MRSIYALRIFGKRTRFRSRGDCRERGGLPIEGKAVPGEAAIDTTVRLFTPHPKAKGRKLAIAILGKNKMENIKLKCRC